MFHAEYTIRRAEHDNMLVAIRKPSPRICRSHSAGWLSTLPVLLHGHEGAITCHGSVGSAVVATHAGRLVGSFSNRRAAAWMTDSHISDVPKQQRGWYEHW
jgi:hypothetical protein